MADQLEPIHLLKLQLVNEKLARLDLLIEKLSGDIEHARALGAELLRDRSVLLAMIKDQYQVGLGDEVNMHTGNISRVKRDASPTLIKPVDA
jgi:hypothetical protein